MRVTKRRIEVAMRHGIATVDSYTFGEWGAYQHGTVAGAWSLVLLPLGLCLPPDWSTFRTLEQACGAMAELQRSRNQGWDRITQEDLLTPGLGDRLKTICKRHGAIAEGESYSCAAVLADEPRVGISKPKRLNGFALDA